LSKEKRNRCSLFQFKGGFSLFKELFSQPYQKPKYPKEFQAAQEMIFKKSWLMHCGVIAVRAFLAAAGVD
jgi:hypothetical protein